VQTPGTVCLGATIKAVADWQTSINELWWSDKSQMLQHVLSAVAMVADLPEHATDRTLPSVVQVGCLEAFFLNARLAIEFLTRPSGRDFTAWSWVPDWVPGPQPEAERLSGDWLVATRQVVHFSVDRLQDPDRRIYLDTSRAGLQRIGDDIQAVFDEWLRARSRQPGSGEPTLK
jgi:hypothetical protein